jgi:hypothetical protein
MATVRPNSDVLATGWTPSVGGTVFGTVDEVDYDEADYSVKPVADVSPLILGLDAAVPAGTHYLAIRLSTTFANTSIRAHMLDGSSNIVGVSPWAVAESASTTHRLVLVTSASGTRVRLEVAPENIILTEDDEPMLTESGEYILSE